MDLFLPLDNMNKKNTDDADTKQGVCPVCGSPTVMQSGCETCPVCGWSKCHIS